MWRSQSRYYLVYAFIQLGEIVQIPIRVPLKTNWQLVALKLVLDKKTKQSLGIAYLWFVREEHAVAAIEEMNGQFFEGRFIDVALVKPGSCKTRRDSSPYKS